jgi:hypothetical protein
VIVSVEPDCLAGTATVETSVGDRSMIGLEKAGQDWVVQYMWPGE